MPHQTHGAFHEKGLNPIAHITLLATGRSAARQFLDSTRSI
jgi:hypothetical protein